ncbi:MAG: 16S rRNA (adenine(1518)-N(6)/adenine(1519)-N(6))-dimethyltransferase RsmA [Bacilli bacterium]|nr:16S rRNA (adenine(1518)-N(6)/adenine(1519)-N(6))-dimethyltransferase RsmA [Bacilli bacterium]MDD4795151.1 16S rRNA (adenine(1518)-N(6)/adenine(1519)-N(6))-dimethyltransferase RsmA [Bacilli bacterium]
MNKFNYKKKYGQNFLIDNNVLDNILSNLDITPEDLIIEIGAGSGNLTKKLTSFNAQIIAYEIDIDTKAHLDKIQRLTFIYDDILKRNIKEDLKHYQYKNLYIIGNLPYYITTPIIEKITKEDLNPKGMYFMVQKEVAERLTSPPKNKEYGYITVYLKYYYNIEKLFNVSKNSFFPIPNVESAVIKLTKHNMYQVKDKNEFIKLISDAFKHKRKTLLNNLSNYDKDLIKSILEKHEYPILVRAEELPIEFFIELANAL